MLEVAEIEVAYGAAPALRGVSVTVGAGEPVCVVGPNGAGKTTLINAIAGLHPVRAGRLAFAGRDVTANSVDVYVGYLRRKLAQLGSEARIEAVRGIGFALVR